MDYICPICGREGGINDESHHLKPKMGRSRTKVHGADNRVTIHKICHQKIHATFTENELLKYYHTVDRILEHPDIQKFVKWISNKEPNYYTKNNETKNKRRSRRR